MSFLPVTACHGCGGKGWVSPSYGVAVKCPICGGSGQPTNTTKPTMPKITVDSDRRWEPKKRKCPNEGNLCNCTGACMGLPQGGGVYVYSKSGDGPTSSSATRECKEEVSRA